LTLLDHLLVDGRQQPRQQHGQVGSAASGRAGAAQVKDADERL
jgi:hypothetical protein